MRWKEKLNQIPTPGEILKQKMMMKKKNYREIKPPAKPQNVHNATVRSPMGFLTQIPPTASCVYSQAVQYLP